MPLNRPQIDHADLGLIPDTDHTEDLRPSAGKSEAPEVAASEASKPTLTRK